MNEDDVTTLLDRLGRDIEVSSAPTVAATEAGRRRLRWRHRAQVGGAAVAVLAVTAGGFAVQQHLGDTGRDVSAADAEQSPSDAALLGHWRPIELDGAPVRATDTLDFSLYRARLMWGAYDDCNPGSGTAIIGAGGQFTVPSADITQLGCSVRSPYSAFDAVTHARHIAVTNGRLVLSTRGGAALGVFVHYDPTQKSADPRLPGGVPSRAELVGRWLWDTKPSPSGEGTSMDPRFLDIHSRSADEMLAGHNGPALGWSAYGGCNNFASGELLLDLDGAYRLADTRASDLMCTVAPKPGDEFPSSVVIKSQWLRLQAGRLVFYDAGRHVQGVFTRAS